MGFRLFCITLPLLFGCTSTRLVTKEETLNPRKLLQEKPAPATTPVEQKVAEDRAPAGEEKSSTKEAQTITISLAQVSKDLATSPESVRRQASILATYLNTGRTQKDLQCSRSPMAVCDLFKDFRNKESQRERASASTGGSKGRVVPIRPHHFSSQQGMSYGRLMKSLSREPAERVLVWVPKITETQGCPRNLSAAAIRKIENLLPERSAQNAIEKLYEHAAGCIRPTDEGYLITHFRQALLRKMWGNNDGAVVAINRAALAQNESTAEMARTLYWAGALQKKKSVRDQNWRKLLKEHPLSYHALEVWRHLKQDPYEFYTSRPSVEFTRGAPTQDLERAIRWIEALYLTNNPAAAQKLSNWVVDVYRDDIPASSLLYVSALKSSQNTPLNTITFLQRRISENPRFLNEQTLRMLFPKPYFEIFEAASNDVDTFLLMSVARQESGFNPRARSVANARGLLQILPSTARQMTGKKGVNLYDEHTNVRLGVQYLGKMIDKFGSVELALAAYNAGPGRIPTWQRRYPTNDISLFVDLIPFSETRNYVSLIVRNNYWYDRLYRGDLRSLAKSSFNQSGTAGVKKRSDLVNRLLSSHINRSKASQVADRMPASEEQESETF